MAGRLDGFEEKISENKACGGKGEEDEVVVGYISECHG